MPVYGRLKKPNTAGFFPAPLNQVLLDVLCLNLILHKDSSFSPRSLHLAIIKSGVQVSAVIFFSYSVRGTCNLEFSTLWSAGAFRQNRVIAKLCCLCFFY